MKGFEIIPWSDGLPGGGPAERSYDSAVECWRACWIGAPVREMIANLHDCHLVDGPQQPGTQTDAGVVRQAWVCSPWTAFGLYGFAEARKVQDAWSRWGAKAGALTSATVLTMAAPDRCRQVRNFLFSTPIHPESEDGSLLAQETLALADSSGLPVLCRGLAANWRNEEIQDAKAAGLVSVPTRSVWLFDGTNPDYLQRHNTQIDLALARKSVPLRLTDPEEVEPWVWDRLADVYAQLYLVKHNELNPAYTARFLQAAARSGLLEFLVFSSPDGKGIDAFVGLFNGAGQGTCPLVGVDTRWQKERGLYRKCCALCFGLAATRSQKLNFSSGAGHFKRLRGGVQSLEYALLAVPPSDRIKRKFWETLGKAVERWVAPVLIREGL